MHGKRTDFRAWLGLGLLALALSACGALGGAGGDELPPPPTREPAGPPTPTPEPESVSEETTAGQQERFELVWQQLRQGYAYRDYNGVDWNAIEDIYRTQVADGMTEEMFQAAMAAMVSELGDASTFYLTPEELAEQQEALESAEDEPEVGYVGTLVGMPDDVREVMTILYVFPGSPAEEAGVLPHDVIVGIDGEPVPPEPEEDILERVRGEIGSEVVLTLQAPGEEPRDLTVGRAPLGRGGEIDVRVLEGDIGYIFVPPGTEDAALGTRVT
ncbi:MAG: PDZ domain-containing protein, partial [Anaerolineae bacterium]